MHADTLSTLIAEIAAAARKPLEEASTLPPAAYTSEALLDLELEEIFAKEWICLGRVEEIPQAGDYFATRIGNDPLIVVRTAKDEIRVLSNVCRHKSSQLLSGAGNVKRIVCPYHAWTYDLEGRLVHTRFMENTKGFEHADNGLHQVRSEIWRGFIYANIDGRGPKVSEWLSELDARIGDYHMESMRLVCGDDEVWAANWKLLFENFTDTYHTFHTHRDSINRYTPVELTQLLEGGEAYSFNINPLLKDAMTESPFEPHHPSLSEQQRLEFCMMGVFPAQMIALAPDRFFYMTLMPLGTGHVRTKWGVACYEDDPPRETIDNMNALYRNLNHEDRPRVEGVQTGMRSRFAAPGRMSEYENLNWDFTRYLARRLAPQASR